VENIAMQTVLFATALVSFLALVVLASVRGRLSMFSKWKWPLKMLAWLCAALWLGSIVLLLVFFPDSIPPSPPNPWY
jgi:VIT1/CCC1 family predicted Fe2+/Mn2+ transporter